MPAVTAAQPQKAMGQDAAFEEGVELGLGRSAGSAPVAASADCIETMLRAIIGIEIPLVSLTGKWKLSQNRLAADRDGEIRDSR